MASSGEFLELPGSSRIAALGEAGVALGAGVDVFSLNPASVGRLSGSGVSFTHGAYFGENALDDLVVCWPTSRGGFGFNMRSFSYGTVEGLDSSGNATAGVSPRDLAVSLGYARSGGWGQAGFAGKYVQSKLVDSASTPSADLSYETPLIRDRWRGAIVAQNIFGELNYGNEGNALGPLVRIGTAYFPRKELGLALDVVQPSAENLGWALGAEYSLRPAGENQFVLRGGYNNARADVSGAGGLSLGLGFQRRRFAFDYAYVPLGDLGTTQWVTVSWRWERAPGASVQKPRRRAVRPASTPRIQPLEPNKAPQEIQPPAPVSPPKVAPPAPKRTPKIEKPKLKPRAKPVTPKKKKRFRLK